jgi:antitoxin YefM
VVVLSEDDFRSIKETLCLASIPGMREKIMNGLKVPIHELIEDSDE